MFAILLSENMNPFYRNIGSFPTVFFTFFLLIFVLYWIIAVLGWVGIDVLDVDLPDADGDISQPTDSASPNVLAGLLMQFGLHGVPVTVIFSFIALFGWLISYYTVHFFFDLVPFGVFRFLFGLLLIGGALYTATLLTAILIKPLRRFFLKAQQKTEKKVVGQTAVVRTSKVTSNFGEAVLDDGGAGLILKVRSKGDTQFKQGDRVVLLEYLKTENVYHVMSEQEFSGF